MPAANLPHHLPIPLTLPGLKTLQAPNGKTLTVIEPVWPAPNTVRALFTTRPGGFSAAPWNGWNLGTHVHDDPGHVRANRDLLAHCIQQLSNTRSRLEPVYLEQVHGLDTALLGAGGSRPLADAAISGPGSQVCTVMVADCLPVLFAHRQAPFVAAAHAGWRGLAGQDGIGILEACYGRFEALVRDWLARHSNDASHSAQCQAAQGTVAWLGPCIGPLAFEVGDEVRQAFCAPQEHAEAALAAECFQSSPHKNGRWLANLVGLARLRLLRLGVGAITGNDASPPWCTVQNEALFFSHRRDAGRFGSTGRMAACIWLDQAKSAGVPNGIDWRKAS